MPSLLSIDSVSSRNALTVAKSLSAGAYIKHFRSVRGLEGRDDLHYGGKFAFQLGYPRKCINQYC